MFRVIIEKIKDWIYDLKIWWMRFQGYDDSIIMQY
jgi:hypothetical protein